MKVLAFIIGILFQVLTLLPCSDTEECALNADTPVRTEQSHGTHQHDNEMCSPFCVCNCCTAATAYMPVSFTEFRPLLIFENAVEHIMGQVQFLSYEYQTIWQPPQLV